MRHQALLRKANALCSAAMLALFLTHAVGNVFQMVGFGVPVPKVVSHLLLLACLIHVVIGVWLTVSTFRAQRQAGAAYWKLNRRFWAVRASGLAVALFMVAHLLIFWRPSSGPVRLAPFGPAELAASLLLVLSIAVHVIANAHPLMLALGVPASRARAADLVVALSILLLVMAVGFVVYYLRWSVI